MASSTVVGNGAKKLPAAIRHLMNHGVEALKPQLILNSNTRNPTHWNPPAVSKRQMNVIRKRSIQMGTFGKFDSTTGLGWDPAWDVELATTQGNGGTGRIRIRPKKKTSRERTRELRAQKIEKNMEDMDEEIAKYYLEKQQHKPVKDWEYYYKKHGKRR